MKLNHLLSIVTLFSFLLGCNAPNTPSREDRVEVENGEDLSGDRVELLDDELVIESFNSEKRALDDWEMPGRLFVRARISHPDFEGENLHANHVTVSGDYAFVSYSTVNETYRGGVEVIHIEDVRHPRIKSRILYRDTDVTIARESDGRLFIGGATDSDNDRRFKTPAMFEAIEMHGHKIGRDSQQFDLPSSNGNDILVDQNKVYVTSGTRDGAVSIFSAGDLALISSVGIPGAKAILKHDGHLLVMEGTGTNLHIIDPGTMTLLKTLPLGYPNYFQAKAEMAVSGRYLYASAWESGLVVIDPESGVLVDRLELPKGVHCNSVSIADNRWVFMANGNDGLWILEITNDGLRKIGKVRMEGSTNYVATSDCRLLMANGKSGVLIVEITQLR